MIALLRVSDGAWLHKELLTEMPFAKHPTTANEQKSLSDQRKA